MPVGPIRTLAPLGVTACVLAIGAAACRPTEAVAPGRRHIRIATAFAPLSEPLTAEYRQRLPDVDVQALPVGDVITAIEAGTVDVGIAFADDAYFAYERGWSQGLHASTSRLRGIALLLPLPQYVLVRGNAGFASIADLRGKRVGVGPVNSPVARIALQVLDAFEIHAHVVHIQTRAEGATDLKNGAIDAAFFPGYVYPDKVTDDAIRSGARLVPIAGPAVERLRRDHPFIRVVAIPRGIYPGQDRIVPTVGVDMVVLCERDLDAALVYDLTARLFDVFPRLVGVEATVRYLNPDEAPATPIPLHLGAARYFRERELSR
ncbi:MAG TPA: TAXI family TRAP transporter solute-binding subunit [Vicinamibacterales bacterium]|nr:TAXI family TRAP transporter solute-binding subunit [Vicinamibacterales bacterium]